MNQAKHVFLSNRLNWDFPAEETHDGIPLSNGTLGALLWGGGRQLRITINRADYWDHRGGMAFSEEATYENLKRWLQAGNETRMRQVFEASNLSGPEDPPRPTRLPMGRVDIELPPDMEVIAGGLDMLDGQAEIELSGVAGEGKLQAVIVPDQPVLVISVSGIESSNVNTILCPPQDPEVIEHFQQYGFPECQLFDEDGFAGWVQECPGEPAMCVGCLRAGTQQNAEIFITSVYGDTPQQAIQNAREILTKAAQTGYQHLARQTAAWWRDWWDRTAAINLPDRELELLYYLGIYKLAGLSPPGSPAATLQGPWIEEYHMPPWGGDYHFNVNVQECYWPALAANHPETLMPLVQLLDRWQPKLREYATRFTGIEDGLQLPHSVDDRCTCMGGFWTGTVDHASTAWTGQLLWLYCRHTADLDFLRETAYPFLKAAMRVYQAMLEDTGGHWHLPLGISPEFGGSENSAWGANASYQLAAIHFLCRALIQASELLGLDEAEREYWQDVDRRLPAASTDPEGGQIYLWAGQPLNESHRHHSHLAGIYPFDTLGYGAGGQHEHLVRESLYNLTLRGMGAWSGWCVPWAAILFARTGNGGMAELLLQIYRRVFMNQGYASLHDTAFPGFTVMGGRGTIMQIEAALGAAAAVLEMLLHTWGGVLHIFPALPANWPDVSFQSIRAEGAFLCSAEMNGGRCGTVTVHSEAGQTLRLANPWPDQSVQVMTDSDDTCQVLSGAVLPIKTEPGQTLTIKPY